MPFTLPQNQHQLQLQKEMFFVAFNFAPFEFFRFYQYFVMYFQVVHNL